MLDNIDNLLDDAISAHEAKDFNAAAIKYTKILEQDAHHADANHNFGLLTIELGFKDDALIFLQTAINTNPNVCQYWVTCVDTLINTERFYDAQSVLEKAHLIGYRDEVFEHLRHNLDLKQQQCKTLVKLKLGDDVPKSFDQAILEMHEDDDCYKSSARTDGNLKPNKKVSHIHEPSQDHLQSLMELFSQQRFEQVFEQAQKLTKQYSNNLNYWNLMGVAAVQLGHLDQAALAFQSAINIDASSADAHNNLGNVLIVQGKSKEAIMAFEKAISIKPDYAEAHYNVGNVLQDNGKFELAVEAYKKAISYKPDYAEAYRGLSSIYKYNIDDPQLLQVEGLLSSENISDHDKCSLNFALAKMYEDTGELEKAFNCLSDANAQRKMILNYSIRQDEKLFQKVIKIQPSLLKNTLEKKEISNDLLPIFIVGMPRSGTTLVEQIISSHSEVTGAGELNLVSKYGSAIATGEKTLHKQAISEFREKYLSEAAKLSKGKRIFTDKMPQNFRFIPLVCAAFPEAKIIHVERDAAATCWSNYKQYFVSKNIGYCYDLEDVTRYYKLYKNLMKLWQSDYSDRIYNLKYEKLTTDQEKETNKLIKYLKIDWEDACLSPHRNNRSVRTASQGQVREKLYQGSSEAWRKYERLLDGVFDTLTDRSYGILESTDDKASHIQEPSQDQLESLMELFSQQRYEQVFEQAQKLTKQYSNNLNFWNLVGVAAVQLGHLDQAGLAFQSAININSSSADAHNNLGNVLTDQGKSEKAMRAFQKAISIKPDYANAHYNIGNLFLDDNNLEEAVDAFEKALSINPHYVDAYTNLGNALKRQDKPEEAKRAFEKALSIKSDSSI